MISQIIKESIENIISENLKINNKYLSKFLMFLLFKIIKLTEIDKLSKDLNDLKDKDFIESLFDYLNFSYKISQKDLYKIPTESKLIVISNHPLGALDGLALCHLVSQVRNDYKIVANSVLGIIKQISSIIIPLNLYNPQTQKSSVLEIEKSLIDDNALIFFPAAEVSRYGLKGIKDNKWKKGVVQFASKYNVPVLPVYIEGRNSYLFYLVSLFSKRLSILLLSRELFNKKNKSISIQVGNLITSDSFNKNNIAAKIQIKLLRKHVYKIPKNEEIFKTIKPIIQASNPIILRKELSKLNPIGITKDKKVIYLATYIEIPNVMKEISRLRELTFRKVGEGTGKKCDFDEFDYYYEHLILWDDIEMEIVGSYRICKTKDVLRERGIEGLYNSSQFKFKENFSHCLENGLELGRSFVQQKYWGSASLNYIWQGIGEYLNLNSDIKYLFGSVSISDSYSELAKSLIVYYYQKWYDSKINYIEAYNSFKISNKLKNEVVAILNGDSYDLDFLILKNVLKSLGYTIPVFLRRYTELCTYGGATFLDYAVDNKFSNSIDCFIMLNLDKLKEEAKEKYFSNQRLINTEKIS